MLDKLNQLCESHGELKVGRGIRHALVLLVAALSACAAPDVGRKISTSPEATTQMLANARCCVPLAEAVPSKVPNVGEHDEFELGANLSLIRLPEGGKSFFRLYQIPDDGSAYYFTLDSYGVNGHVFAPVVYILNADRTVSRRSQLQMLRYWEGNPLWGQPPRFSLAIRVDVEPGSRERFLLVATDEQAVGNQFNFRVEHAPNTTFYFPISLSAAATQQPKVPQVRAVAGGSLRLGNASSWSKKPGDGAFRF